MPEQTTEVKSEIEEAPPPTNGAAPELTDESRPEEAAAPCAAHRLASRDERGGRDGAKPGYVSPTALQDLFLNGLRRENIDVVVYFCDGAQERGVIRGFDTFTILLENRNSGKAQLLYKHSIARIFPTRTPSQMLPERSKK